MSNKPKLKISINNEDNSNKKSETEDELLMKKV